MPLLPRQKRFVEEYIIDHNATKAAMRAGYGEKSAHDAGHEQLKRADIQELLAEREKALGERTEITQELVLRRYWEIATADPNDLIQYRRVACPECWQPKSSLYAAPNEECTACDGQGQGVPFALDTRHLSGSARHLYAGLKVTEKGFEIKLHNQLDALEKVGRHLGMFKDRVEHSGSITLEQLVEASAIKRDE